ncbi:MAG: DUF3857 domain-containing protein [Bacteroidetes bacterium]|nr:DUF3857 domain-containing protein [Bacteroidota bacterium]
MKRKHLLLAVIYCLVMNIAFAQDKSTIQYGKISAKDFEIPRSKVIDSSCSGIIISDIGNINFKGNARGWFDHIFNRKTRISILNKNGFDLATIKIRLYLNEEDDREKCDDIEATTYNLVGGQIVQTKLVKKDIFEVRLDKHHIEKRFTFPSVKEGSIIEYSYSIISRFSFNLPDWSFQTDNYPCLWSELNVEIPNLIVYAFRRQGYDSFYLNKSSMGHKGYNVTDPRNNNPNYAVQPTDISVSSTTSIHHWAMKDVPALNSYAVKYISSPLNFLDMIEFQEYQSSNGRDEHDMVNVYDMVKDWRTATSFLLSVPDFGGVLDQDNSWFDDKLKKITGDENDQLAITKTICQYLKDNFVCTNYRNIHVSKSLVDVFIAKSGTVGEINMLLTALLREKHIEADPVVLRTRMNGYNSDRYPILEKIDYAICKAKINGETYYLDATRPLLGFGKLPEECYNGYARTISNERPGSVYFLTESLDEKKMTSVIIINDAKGYPSGNLQITPGYHESYNLRQAIKKKTEKNFFMDIQTSYGSDVDIENTGIDSLTKLDYPVNVHYDFNVRSIKNQDIFYFNPMLQEGYKENPFKAGERKFPVEMPHPIDEMYVLNMEIPTGYIVEELPKSVKIAYNGNEGFFEYMIGKDETNVQLRSHIKLNRTNYLPEEYNALRSFFSEIVKKHAEQIVFKKKK